MRTLWLVCIIATLFQRFVSDDSFLDELNVRFQIYQRDLPQFKVELILNQDEFAPGDTIWLKAFLLTEDNGLVAGTHVVNLYLVDESGKMIDRWFLEARDGKCTNQIILRDDLAPGAYRLVSSSDWMQNFDEEFYFNKTIQIASLKKRKILNADTADLKFYPEGGHLIDGVMNNVVVEGSLSWAGKEISINEGKGRPIKKVVLNEQSIGSFIISPSSDHQYVARLAEKEFTLPPVERKYPAIFLAESQKGIRLRISINKKEEQLRDDLFLIVTSQGKLIYSSKVNFGKEASVSFTFLNNSIPDRLSRFTLMNSKRDVLAERFYYNSPRNEPIVQLTTDQPDYNQREQVTVRLKLTDQQGSPLLGDATLRVLNGAFVSSHTDWSDRLNWKSELNQSLQNRLNKATLTNYELNRYLILQNTGRLNWENVWDSGNVKLEYPMSELIHLRGKVVNKNTGQAQEKLDSVKLLLFMQDEMLSYEVEPDQNGKFDIPFVFGLHGESEIVYFIRQGSRPLPQLKMINEQGPVVDPLLTSETEDEYAFGLFSNKLKSINLAYNSKEGNDFRMDNNLNSRFDQEFSGHIKIINVQDYVIFPNMEELIREVIPLLQHRKIGDKSKVRVILKSDETVYANDDPLYIIDGVTTKDSEYFLQLKPSELLEIGIIYEMKELRKLGIIGINGVVLVKTSRNKKGMAASDVLKMRGLMPELTFPQKNYAIDNNLLYPDFRSTIYWNPSILLDKNGEATVSFYGSDDLGEMNILVEGLTTEGQPFSNRLIYNTITKSN